MGSSKVIFFLQCTALAHLSSYIIGAYNFTRCNHTVIIRDYQRLLQNNIQIISKGDNNKIKAGHIINCCPELQPRGAMLACIHNFTKSCVAKQHLVLWNLTVALLEQNCDGYSENNGSRNVEARFRNSLKCISQRKEKCGKRTSKELEEMWNSYMRIRNVNSG